MSTEIRINEELAPTYEALKADRDAQHKRADALAVENAALKAAHPQPFGREMMKALDAYEKHQDEVPETGMLDAFFILRDSIMVETPATDAALAAIEARGVEKAAEYTAHESSRAEFINPDVSLAFAGLVDDIRELANELREAK